VNGFKAERVDNGANALGAQLFGHPKMPEAIGVHRVEENRFAAGEKGEQRDQEPKRHGGSQRSCATSEIHNLIVGRKEQRLGSPSSLLIMGLISAESSSPCAQKCQNLCDVRKIPEESWRCKYLQHRFGQAANLFQEAAIDKLPPS